MQFAGVAPDLTSVVVAAFFQAFQITQSRSDARRLVEQGSVQWQGGKVSEPHVALAFIAGGVLRLDKKHAVRIG